MLREGSRPGWVSCATGSSDKIGGNGCPFVIYEGAKVLRVIGSLVLLGGCEQFLTLV